MTLDGIACRISSIALCAALTLLVAAGSLMAQTGGGATLVGTVRDATGASVAGAKVTVLNKATSFIAETTTAADGAYYVPYLTPGDYQVKVTSPGFKEFVREGITLRSAEVPRVDISLELGSVNDSVTVRASASLLNTENVVSAYVLPENVLVETPGVMKRTVYLLQYMPGIVGVLGQAGFHIQGQAQNDIGFSLDGISAKSPYTGVVNQVDGVIQGSTDAMEEVKVLTTGVSAEYGHSAGGSMKMVYKSGTNSLHASFEDRYLNGSWVPSKLSHAAAAAARGPLVLPDVRSGGERPGGNSQDLQRPEQDFLALRLRHQSRAHH
jgi:Predicted outer membrane protein